MGFLMENSGNLVWALLNMVLMLGVVVALAYLVLVHGVGRWMKRSQNKGSMRIKERLILNAKNSVLKIEIDGREWLVASSDAGVQLLHSGVPDVEQPSKEQSLPQTLLLENPEAEDNLGWVPHPMGRRDGIHKSKDFAQTLSKVHERVPVEAQ